MAVNTPTMLDIISFGERHASKTVNQYAAHIKRLFDKRGYADRHLSIIDGTLHDYLLIAPKYRKGNAALNKRISDWGITPNTYKQYQSDGRRMIETFTGTLQKRLQRRGMQDGFAKLQAILPDLVAATLVKNSQTRNLPGLVDLARSRGWDMTDITRDRIISLREDCFDSDTWGRIKQGAAFLDYLRQFPTCIPLLPEQEIGCLAGVLRLDTAIPDFLAEEAQIWVNEGSIVYQDGMFTDEAREATAKENSDSSKAVCTAALRAYIREVGTSCDFGAINGLTSLFRPDLIEVTLTRLCKKSGTPNGLTASSLFSYTSSIKRLLRTKDLEEEAAKIEQLIKSLPTLLEGQAASSVMTPKVEAWCRALLIDPAAMEIFETQHFRYAEKAIAAVELADAEGIDLVAFSRAPETQPLCEDQRRLALDLLRKARMYGVCAAFAAIELEGAPFRKSNVIKDLKVAGHPQTFFDHRSCKLKPRMEIHIPNELLKNGDAMTRRNQYMPRFSFEKDGLGHEGFTILSFYLDRIRPLFQGSELSDHVFPDIDAKPRALVMSTFDGWLAECSHSIGLFLLPHNFRHGICTIEISHDPTCYAELETVTGDLERTLRRHYAFIDRERLTRSLQERRFERRALRMSDASGRLPAAS